MKLLNSKLSFLSALAVLPLVFAIGCSSSGNGGNLTGEGGDDTTDDGNAGSGGDSDPGTPVETQELRLGRGFDSQFEPGLLEIQNNNLEAGASTSVSVTLVDQNSAARTDSFDVTFSSECISRNLATVTPDSPVSSANGRASVTYVAQGCQGDDTITASAVSNGVQVQASGMVNVAEARLGSIRFISAEPDNISLRGAGGAGRQETSAVIFQVRDDTGGPVRGQLVRFSLSTNVGGTTLTPQAVCSNGDGNVRTVVQAGDIATAVRVNAQLIDNEPRGANGACDSAAVGGDVFARTQSDELTISTGVPDFDSTSLSATILNPEGLNFDGTVIGINMRLADRFNNPVPDGTAVQFQTEGGSIESQCLTEGGGCTVEWTSQNPRPPQRGLSNAGRSTILAFAIGEENFDDLNGSGRFDPADDFPAEDDIGEAWRDDNESGFFNSPEDFIDFDGSGDYSFGNNQQNSILCEDPNRCALEEDGTPKLLNVYRNLTIVMSGPAEQILYYNQGPSDQPSTLPDFNRPGRTSPVACDTGRSLPNATDGVLSCGVSYNLLFCDANNNVIPAGSTISYEADGADLVGGSSFTVPSFAGLGGISYGIRANPTGDDSQATITVTATTPLGIAISRTSTFFNCADGDSPGGGAEPGNQQLRLGRGSGAQFEEGELNISPDSIAAGGTSTIGVSLVDENGNLRTDSISVAFSSPCVSQGLATITSPVNSNNGRAESTYVADGCQGNDTITASAVNNGSQVQASGVVNVAPALLGSLRFISADPDNIALRGAGGAGRQETSTVIFQVRDRAGAPVRGQLVRFSLSSTVGGTSLSTDAICSDGAGNVRTIVQSGDIATTVRIAARLIGDEPRGANGACNADAVGGTVIASTQSDELTISTGVPDDDSTSLAASNLAPEALDFDGTESIFTMRLADRFNNPVPDGTAVQFRTEGGSIEPQCTTVNGACSVRWVSQGDRPPVNGRSNAGRSTILAFVIGEENFDDQNGNGVFDEGDVFPPQRDLPEAWRDDNENGIRNGVEPFIDFNQSGSYSGADGLQSSVLCSDQTRCDFDDDGRPQLLNVFRNFTLVMAGAPSQILVYEPGNEPDLNSPPNRVSPVACDNGQSFSSGGFELMCGQSYNVLLCDRNDNTPPTSTSIEITADDAELLGPTSFTVPNSNAFGGVLVSFFAKASGEEDTGLVTILATTPSGAVQSRILTLGGCQE